MGIIREIRNYIESRKFASAFVPVIGIAVLVTYEMLNPPGIHAQVFKNDFGFDDYKISNRKVTFDQALSLLDEDDSGGISKKEYVDNQLLAMKLPILKKDPETGEYQIDKSIKVQVRDRLPEIIGIYEGILKSNFEDYDKDKNDKIDIDDKNASSEALMIKVYSVGEDDRVKRNN